MEIWSRKFFEPADIDVDPRFELIAEYRDYAKLRQSREADAIADSLINWATKLHYELADDPLLSAATEVAVGLKQVITALPFSDRTPPGMAEVVVKTQSLGESIQKVIGPLNEKSILRRGTAMTHEELRLALEKLRRQDCRTYLSDPANSIFQSEFAPINGRCPVY